MQRRRKGRLNILSWQMRSKTYLSSGKMCRKGVGHRQSNLAAELMNLLPYIKGQVRHLGSLLYTHQRRYKG